MEIENLHSELKQELENKLEIYYQLKNELQAGDILISEANQPTGPESGEKWHEVSRSFLQAMEDSDDKAVAKLLAIMIQVMDSNSKAPRDPLVPNSELTMLHDEIEQFKVLNRHLSLKVMSMKLEDRIGREVFRVLQPPLATEKRNAMQSNLIAGVGGIGALLCSCLLLALITRVNN